MVSLFELSASINSTSAGDYKPFSFFSNATRNRSHFRTFSDMDKLYGEVEKNLKIYYSAFLMIIGTAFNIFSIVILSRAAFRRTSTSIYLRFLAVVDLLVLYNGLSRHFLSGVAEYNVRLASESLCKFNQWSTSFGPDTSAWILVAVTTERVISIVWPHKVKVICSKVTVIATLVGVTLVIIASNIPLLLFYGNKEVKIPDSNRTVTQKCVPLKPVYDSFLEHQWYWLDFAKFVVLPSSILTTFNIIIIVVVVRSRLRVERRGGSLTNGNKEHGCASRNVNKKISSLSLGKSNSKTTSIHSLSSQSWGSNKEISLTVTLLAVNTTFVVCNTPVMVYLLGAPYWFQSGPDASKSLVFTASVMAMYTNNAANFLLYCATGSRFRAEIRHLFLAKRHISRLSKLDSGTSTSGDGSCLKKATAKQTSEKNDLATISRSVETCYSQLSAP